MNYICIKEEKLITLLKKMNGKTVYILQYLISEAKENAEIEIRYKTIEEELNIGHTSVGDSMRLLMNLGFISRVSVGRYKINNEVISLITYKKII